MDGGFEPALLGRTQDMLDNCTACGRCVEVCPIDVFIPAPETGASPIILHPEECWYCGCCVNQCPTGALKINWPIQQRGYWQRVATGQNFRA